MRAPLQVGLEAVEMIRTLRTCSYKVYLGQVKSDNSNCQIAVANAFDEGTTC